MGLGKVVEFRKRWCCDFPEMDVYMRLVAVVANLLGCCALAKHSTRFRFALWSDCPRGDCPSPPTYTSSFSSSLSSLSLCNILFLSSSPVLVFLYSPSHLAYAESPDPICSSHPSSLYRLIQLLDQCLLTMHSLANCLCPLDFPILGRSSWP